MIQRGRAWHKKEKKMYKVSEISWLLDGRILEITLITDTPHVKTLKTFPDSVILMHPVGRCDAYGEDIFQDDILAVNYLDEDNKKKQSLGIVKKDETTGNFYWTGEYADWDWNEMMYDHSDRIEVLGNIHENYAFVVNNRVKE